MISVDDIAAPDYLGKVFEADILDSRNRIKNLEAELQATKAAYEAVVTSRRWTIPTKILKFLRIRK
jgi:glucosyltransferase